MDREAGLTNRRVPTQIDDTDVVDNQNDLIVELQQLRSDNLKLSTAVLALRESRCRCEQDKYNEALLSNSHDHETIISDEDTDSPIGSSIGHGHGHDIPLLDVSYKRISAVHLAGTRILWLSLFLASLALTAVVMESFEHILASQIELAFFVPLMIGHGGNVGGQTVGTVLSALSSQKIKRKDMLSVLLKESISGLLVGCALGFLSAFATSFLMGVSEPVSVVVFATLPVLSVTASGLASTLPFLCMYLGLDAAVVSAPLMTTLVDVLGLVSYFMIARGVFSWYGMRF
ncbi:hypothetical protein SARC_05908 [Sphaeroforma arctica JP610]|uniref:SLC41A/MgtE integral membrane domain-containing protein n=1 Tax=Sphaeroforma arctica JP610 TaxID=667725 RepID=A0A0L0FYZ5_9EUKA|nr:hypothetical protein SARC_05908 [Sphaeroforma arctica JP610]KNC81786.1 hypothetical protein SARC_05908 [Sphaeroforma arctica JP610]|eukprot:XP_014155688.1 hypothetical protein SARC_05908 [Sphaeroforma arctica JP610]